MNELAIELNEQIKAGNPHVYEMLSPRGKELFFPKGILTQSAEAKEHAHRFNATIGMATEEGHIICLPSVMSHLSDIAADDALTYAPALGVMDLRKAWLAKQLADNPSQMGKVTTLPIVTNGLTHGLSIVGDLFVGEGDALLLPDKLWGNYRLIFGTRLGAKIAYHPFFNPPEADGLDTDGFRAKVKELSGPGRKLIVLLNFPNNPVGYTPTKSEGEKLARALVEAADAGTNVIALTDDAYFGLTYTSDAMTESLFGCLAGAHPRLLAIKADAATKEIYAWGLRIGFLTFGPSRPTDGMLTALEKKTAGAIRGAMSNCAHLSQTIILKALRSPTLAAERKQKYALMKARAERVRRVLQKAEYKGAWAPYPFNSGYFMCVRVKGADLPAGGIGAEELRKHMLRQYGVGVISIGDEDIRIAFSCLDEGQIEELFDLLCKGVQDLRRSK